LSKVSWREGGREGSKGESYCQQKIEKGREGGRAYLELNHIFLYYRRDRFLVERTKAGHVFGFAVRQEGREEGREGGREGGAYLEFNHIFLHHCRNRLLDERTEASHIFELMVCCEKSSICQPVGDVLFVL